MIGKILNSLGMWKFYLMLRSAWVDFQYLLVSKIGPHPDLYYRFYAKKYPIIEEELSVEGYYN